jgi:hypothetical protein
LEDSREPLHVLHVGKTGGTALNHVLIQYAGVSRFRPVFGGHVLTIADVPIGERFMFFIRDPLSRFVSAFNSRLREGRPRYHYPWRDEEKVAFSIFKTPNELATALSADDSSLRKKAEAAMHGIGHVNTGYSFWFGDESSFRARVSDLFFIGFQERLEDDVSERPRVRTSSDGTRRTSPSFSAAVSSRRASTHSRSDCYARCVVDPVEEDSDVVLLDVFVDRLARPLPVSVVVDDQDTTAREPGIEMHERVLGGGVPVRVEAQQRDLSR